MNNKKGQQALEFLMTYGWAILSAIIVIGALGSYFYFSQPIEYREECYNRTTNIYYSYPSDFYPINCPDELLKTDCYDNNGNKILNLTCEKSDTSCYRLIDNGDFLFVKTKMDDGYIVFTEYRTGSYDPDFIKSMNSWEPEKLKEYKIEEICKQVEVVN